MALKPKGGSNGGNFEQRNFPTPKAGARRARVSLIVDLGTQDREPIWVDPDTGKAVKEGTDGAELKELKPTQQIAIFADLVNDVVDYGGDIGEAQYRLMLNKSFKGNIQGINLQKMPPTDNKGNIIQGKSWNFHINSILSKLGKAVEIDGFGEDGNDDVEVLLGKQFFADVEVKETNSGKQDKDGNDIIYKNVNFKNANKVAAEIKTDEDGNERSEERRVGKECRSRWSPYH